MDHDSEILQKVLLSLVTEGDNGLPCIPGSWPPDDLSPMAAGLSQDQIQGTTTAASDRDQSEIFPSQRLYLLNLGDIPTVQDRFYRLLKSRLASEAQRKLPLFPWETEVHDYESAAVVPAATSGLAGVGASARLWMTQLKNFGLPVAMPENLLAQLFERCQEVAQSSLLEGAKLVQAVETLFPGESYALNDLAGLVMTSPARSGEAAVVDYPPSYDAAAPNQQMVLSLLAAREILGALTLQVSMRQPMAERQWLTEFGNLSLVTHYTVAGAKAQLRIQGSLPCAGSLTLRTDGQSATAQLSSPGELSVSLDIQPNQPCTLEVCLATDLEQAPILFTVRTDAA